MKFVSGITKEEKRIVTGIQGAVGAKQDNSIGPDTLVGIAQRLCPDIFPVDVVMYGMPTLVGEDILAFDPDTSLSHYEDAISGSFTYIAGETPCSIMVNNGKDVWSAASKAWAGFPESVICKYKDGSIRIHKVKTTAEIPNRKDLIVAVGGMGLLAAWDPYNEGFRTFQFNGETFNHGDVLRDTNHTVLGHKNGFFYGVYFSSKTASEINEMCKNNFKFEDAILLDGGHIAAFNGEEVNINLNQKQGYGIQFIKRRV